MQIARDTYKVALCFCGFAFHVATRCMRRWQVDNGLAQALTHAHPCTRAPTHRCTYVHHYMLAETSFVPGKEIECSRLDNSMWETNYFKHVSLDFALRMLLSHTQAHTPEAIKLCMLNKKATTTASRMKDFVRQCERFDTLTGFGFNVIRFLSLLQHILIDRLSYNIYLYILYIGLIYSRSYIQQAALKISYQVS